MSIFHNKDGSQVMGCEIETIGSVQKEGNISNSIFKRCLASKTNCAIVVILCFFIQFETRIWITPWSHVFPELIIIQFVKKVSVSFLTGCRSVCESHKLFKSRLKIKTRPSEQMNHENRFRGWSWVSFVFVCALLRSSNLNI